MNECPTCGKILKNERGVKMHHTQVHDEPLHGVSVCNFCGNEYEVPPAREDKTKFCSRECHNKNKSIEYSGDGTHLYEGGAEEVKSCKYCGENFETRMDHKFCSRGCYGMWLSENVVGEKHPNWKGGTVSYRGSGWEERRWEIINRDGLKCVECGMSMKTHIDKFDSELHVHHIKPFRMFDKASEANVKENLETLCSVCHKKKEDA